MADQSDSICRRETRHKNMMRDIDIVIKSCKGDANCPFTGFRWTENNLKFKYVGKMGVFIYSLQLSEDYPENSLLILVDQPHNLKTFNEPVAQILAALAKDLKCDWNMPACVGQVVVDGEDCPEDENYVDDNEDDYYEEMDEDPLLHPLLKQDMDMVKMIYGEQAISHRVFGSLDDTDIDLHLEVGSLKAEVARAWRVSPQEPITVRLHLSISRYLDAAKPRVEVFQPSQKKTGAVCQLQKILEDSVSKRWDKLTNSVVAKQYTKDRKYAIVLDNSKKPAESQLYGHSQPDDSEMTKLQDMGFSQELSRNALVLTRNNFNDAIDLLLTSPEQCSGSLQASSSIQAQQASSSLTSVFSGMLKTFTKSSWETLGGSVYEPKLQNGGDSKKLPSLEYGFLVQVLQYARQRLRTLNEYCVVCDKPHTFQYGSMLKPAVCSEELCVFSFQTLGVMSNAADSIAIEPEVVDLLIAMAKAACASVRKDMIFDPFPSVVHPQKPAELGLNPKEKDMDRAQHALKSLLPMEKMVDYSEGELRAHLDRQDILSYPLLTWIISSNRSHIVKLPLHKQLASMGTPHQFLLMSSAPAKEDIFQEARKKHGSTFAFHGSHIENWHSIMRRGLINASGTQYQLHGKAYGNGIYLSPTFNMSFGYSRGMPGHTTKSSAAVSPKYTFLHHRQDLVCIALCEVINKSIQKHRNDIWVMEEEDFVCTRFFFVYEEGKRPPPNAVTDTQQSQFRQEIDIAMGKI